MATVVFLNGEYEDAGYYRRWFEDGERIVAADGGAAFLINRGMYPDVLVGDLDSLPARLVEQAQRVGVELVRFPTRKDRTDAELAVDEAVRRGAGELVLVGALGGSLDHTFGNVTVLRRLAASGMPARIAAPEMTVRCLVAGETVTLSARPKTRVSLLALEDQARVTLRGFAYELSEGEIRADTCLGLGNSIAARLPTVAVHAGAAAVFVADGGETFAGESYWAGDVP